MVPWTAHHAHAQNTTPRVVLLDVSVCVCVGVCVGVGVGVCVCGWVYLMNIHVTE